METNGLIHLITSSFHASDRFRFVCIGYLVIPHLFLEDFTSIIYAVVDGFFV